MVVLFSAEEKLFDALIADQFLHLSIIFIKKNKR
jgi:hypothetical protein